MNTRPLLSVCSEQQSVTLTSPGKFLSLNKGISKRRGPAAIHAAEFFGNGNDNSRVADTSHSTFSRAA